MHMRTLLVNKYGGQNLQKFALSLNKYHEIPFFPLLFQDRERRPCPGVQTCDFPPTHQRSAYWDNPAAIILCTIS